MSKDPSQKPKKLEQALKRFKVGDDATKAQADRELAALTFESGDQWPAWVKRSREGANPGGDTNPGARPMLTISQIDQPVQQIINQQKNADLGITISPTGDASVEDAEIRQGLIRHIQVQSRAQLARDWAYERAVKCGRGFYEVCKAWSDDPAQPFDQELRVRRILDQSKVMVDPFAQEPDACDGDWAFKWSDYPEDRFQREFPKAKLAQASSQELEAEAEQNKGWIGAEEATRTIRVAEYWYAEYTPTTVTLYTLPDGSEQAIWAPDPVPPGAVPVMDGDKPVSRVVQKRAVRWCKITANEILEETDWEGQYIPIVPVVAKEYNLNGVRLWKGVVEPAMDAQRLVNYAASGVAEAVGIGVKAQAMLDPEQIEGYETQWDQANVRNLPYLPRRAFNDRGEPYPPIERLLSEPPIQAVSQLLMQATQFVQQTTATPASSLGQLDPTHRSGKAIQALQQQSELANSNYLDNLATISMTLEGKILNEMLTPVYGNRPGRIVQILGEDGKPEPTMLNAPFVQGPKGPLPAPPVTNPQNPPQIIDLQQGGQYHVVVEIGKTATTKRQEASDAMGELLPHLPPEMAAPLLPEYIEQLDFPGAKKMAAMARKSLPAHLQEPEDGQPPPIPPDVQQQMDQMQQQMQELQQLADKNKTDLMKAQIQAQADLEKAQVQAQADTQQAQMDGEVRIRVAGIQAESTVASAEIKAMMDDWANRLAHMEALIGIDADQQAMVAQQQHEREMADLGHQQTLEQGEQGAAFTSDQMAQQAALQPPNGTGLE